MFSYYLGVGNGGKQGRGNQPSIGDTDPMRKFGIDPEATLTCKTQENSLLKGKPIRNFSIDPTSSIRTPLLQTPFPRLLYPKDPAILKLLRS